MHGTRKCLALAALILLGLAPTAVHAAGADRRALALLNRVQARTQAIKTLTAEWTYTVAFPDHIQRDSGTFELSKPNQAAIVYDPHTPFYRQIISDGTTLWTFYPPTDSYERTAVDPQGANIRVWDSLVIQAFFNAFTAVKQSAYTQNDLSDLHYAGTERVDDVPYQVLEHRMIGTIAGGVQSPFVQRLYIGPDDLVHRYVLKFEQNGRPGSEVAELANIKTGAPMPAADFAFTLPPSAIPYDAKAPHPPLPAAGTPAPDFTAQDRQGGDLTLSEYRDKVVVLDFWASWWAPPSDPTAHIAQMAALAKKYADQDVVVVLVDTWDTADAWKAWLVAHPEIGGLTQLRDPAARGQDIATTRYKVSRLPTTFVIDKQGLLAGTVAGDTGSMDAVEAALKSAGVTPPATPEP